MSISIEPLSISKRIDYLGQKPNGWKGSHSVSATKKSVMHAQEAAICLHKLGIGSFNVGLEEEGTFCFSWHNEKIIAAFSIEENGSCFFYGKNKVTGADYEFSDIYICDAIEPEIKELLLLA